MNQMIRMAAAAAVVGLGMTAAQPAQSQEPVTSETLMIYAAFAKLEANIQETALVIGLTGLLTDDMAAEREEMALEFENDLAQVERYLDILRGADISDDQRAVLARFEEKWGPIAAKGRELLQEQADTPEYRQRALNFWRMIDAVDDLIDDKLEDMRARYGADWPDRES
ncbi:MAG: hypothetical protein ACK4WC_04710 [Rubrimonas sp.]